MRRGQLTLRPDNKEKPTYLLFLLTAPLVMESSAELRRSKQLLKLSTLVLFTILCVGSNVVYGRIVPYIYYYCYAVT